MEVEVLADDDAADFIEVARKLWITMCVHGFLVRLTQLPHDADTKPDLQAGIVLTTAGYVREAGKLSG